MVHPFLRALDLVGQVPMAEALNVSPQAISKMKRAAEADAFYLLPSQHLRAVERATGGRVTVDELVIERPRGGQEFEPSTAKAAA